jgi:hypothetical protein
MGLEGRKIKDNLVMFGEPLDEKALKALQRNSPTADSILSSLPKSAFIPIESPKVLEEESKKLEEELKKQKEENERLKKSASSRRERKRKKAEEKIVEKVEIKSKIEEPTFIENFIKEKEENMDLEQELAALEQEVVKKKQESEMKRMQEMQEEVIEEKQVAPDMRSQILELLSGEDNPPSEEMINAWKERYGKNGIHVMAFGEGEVYIYHHLTRGEWKKIKELMARLQETEDADEVEEKLKEKVVLYCILFPSVDTSWLDQCKAGVLDSLYQMILLNSGFLTPQQAMLLTTQL